MASRFNPWVSIPDRRPFRPVIRKRRSRRHNPLWAAKLELPRSYP